LEGVVDKALAILKRKAAGRIGVGALAFVLAYTTSGLVDCPVCGYQGLHPWEWGVVLGV